MERLKEIWESYRYQLLILVAVLGLVGAWLMKRPTEAPNQIEQTMAIGSTSSTVMSTASSVGGKVCVDVKGAVRHPGIYKLKGGSRVNEAVAAAGGIMDNADMKQVNLAKQLADQEIVYVPVNGETMPGTSAVGTANVSSASSASGAAIINLNTATKEQLCQITGIGDKKADLILQYREQHGQFKSVDELKQVSGFGDKTVEKIKDQLAV